MKKLVVNRLQNIRGNPRKGYILGATLKEGESFETYEIYLSPEKLQTMALEFVFGSIPWDWNLPYNREGKIKGS